LKTSPTALTPEGIIEARLQKRLVPAALRKRGREAVFNNALSGVTQTHCWSAGDGRMEEAEFLGDLRAAAPRISRLNQFSEHWLRSNHGSSARDEEYELISATTCATLLPHRSGNGEDDTISTRLARSVREPRVLERPSLRLLETGRFDAMKMMDIAAAVACLSTERAGRQRESKKERARITAFEQVKQNQRVIIIGAPGSGKLPFSSGCQLQIALATEASYLVTAGHSAFVEIDNSTRTSAQGVH